MAKKIRIKKSLLNEAINHANNIPDELNDSTGGTTAEDLWNSLFDKDFIQQKDFAKEQLNKAVRDKSVRPVNISKIDKIHVVKADGTEDDIYPSRIAAMAREAMADLSRNHVTAVLAKFFPKDIIWTFDPRIQTAATDGVRIFFNPVFADYLLGLSAKAFGEKAKAMGDRSGAHFLRCLQYVIIHEVYHSLFQHRRRAELKAETAHGKNHQLANIAMDVEINRCIESELLQYQGCTQLIQGMWDERFPVEIWEEIFDAYLSGKATPPNMPDSASSQGGNPQRKQGQQGQQQQGQQQQSGQNQQGQQGQSGQSQPGQQGGQQGGQGGGQSGNQGGQNQPDFQNMSPWFKKGFAQALKDIKSGKIAVSTTAFLMNFDTPANAQDQAEFDAGYQAAIKAYQEAIQQMNSQNSGDGVPNGQTPNGQGGNGDSQNYGDDVSQNDSVDGSELTDAEVSGSTQFGGADMIDTDIAQEIAAEAGQPYDSQDIKDAQNPQKKAADFVKDNRSDLENISNSAKSPGVGKGRGTADMFAKIDEIFKPAIDWKRMLRHFLNQIGKKGVEDTYSRRMLGTTNPDLQAGKYIKYKEKAFYEKNGIAQVFHLIDGSGSMGDTKGDIFVEIFGEIFDMGTKAHIQKSAMAYFASNTITADKVRTWVDGDKKSKVLNTLSRHAGDNYGGTDVKSSIEEVMALGKPYFNKMRPQTLLIVYTDGDDVEKIDQLPISIIKNTIWLIINANESYANRQIEQLIAQGVQRSHALYVDLKEYPKSKK